MIVVRIVHRAEPQLHKADDCRCLILSLLNCSVLACLLAASVQIADGFSATVNSA